MGCEVEGGVICIECFIPALCKEYVYILECMTNDCNLNSYEYHTVWVIANKNAEQHSPLHNLRDSISLLNT